jgi:hypothetical protein
MRLSSAQQRLWFLEQLHPQTAIYNIPVAVRLRGGLNTEALNRAISIIINRHEILRMRFATVDGEPYQLLASSALPGAFAVPTVDLTGLPMNERDPLLQRRLGEEARRPFDLSNESLVRTILFRLDPSYHVFFLNMHHIVSDAFSFELFFRELSRLYEAFPNSADLPKLRMQYAEYSELQAERLAGECERANLDFWKDELADAPAFLELPTDRPRLRSSSSEGDHHFVRLTEEVAGSVQRLSRQEAATPFMLCLSVFKVLLFRLTNQEDILVGIPITGRDRGGTENLIGFFSNTIVVRSHLDAHVSFREFLRQVRATTLRAYAHPELPFERVVEELRPDRRGDSIPLIQVMFDMQSPWGRGLALPGVDTSVEVLNTKTAKFDLSLSMISDPNGWIAEIEFDSELFDPDTIQRWLGHFKVLLSAALAQPDMPIGKLPLMAEAERRQLIKSYVAEHAFILDEFLEPVPIGVKGELYTGDRGVTPGSLHSGKPTKDRFVQSPFEECPGRLYKTGDVARYLPDGNIDLIKVDRKALPPPGHDAQRPPASEVLPRTDVEKALGKIWCTLLKLPRVGIHDSFFKIGGHSLLAIRMVSRVRDAFQIEFQMSSLFERPTIAQLAPVVERQIIEQLQQLTEEEAEMLCEQVA